MQQILGSVMSNIDCFALMFLRISGLLMSSPIFGRRNLPNTLKIALCLLVTYITFAASPQTPVAYKGAAGFILICFTELLFGLALGYVTTLFFSIVQTSGQVMDMQMGFGMVNVFDVQTNISVPVTGNLIYVVVIITFLGVNGHIKLIHIIRNTFGHIPVGAVSLNPVVGLVALEVFALAFLLSVNVAMPLIASGLLGEVAMGFIVRAVPQMNVFVVGIPLKIALGFLMLFLIMPVFIHFTDTIFKNMFISLDNMIAEFAG